MNKFMVLYSCLTSVCIFGNAQTEKSSYPVPEFSNEVYYLKKDNSNTLVRLEKGISRIETKSRMGGLGGSESGYEIEAERSTVRLSSSNNLSFVYITDAAAATTTNPQRDSMMQANGMDASMMQGMGSMNGINDPASSISLFNAHASKNKRKVLLQKNPGAVPFASKKVTSADKYTFSVKKIKEGYWELVIDKSLPKGEYAFTMMNLMSMGAAGETLLFAFGID